GAPALDMPSIHCYFENKAAAACATSALNISCSIYTAFRCLHRIWDRPFQVTTCGVPAFYLLLPHAAFTAAWAFLYIRNIIKKQSLRDLFL
ncbi:MAG: hypothetical protein MSA04_05810, partial [Clostridiales bacterium]|nr:hypothetical protein [Clostridiales bacterium]